MEYLTKAFEYFLSFKPYVMLPIIIFILALVFRIKLAEAVKSALQLGIAFIGIFMTFDYFVSIISPAMEALIKRLGLDMPVLDTGWPPLAGMTWSYNLAPVLLVIFLVLNIILLMTRLTKTVNIDIWNYWHVIFLAALIQHVTGHVWMAILFSSLSFILTLKLAEWSAPAVERLTGMEGVCVPHLSSITHFPLAILADEVLDKIPGFNKLNADPESIKKRLGLLGEPMILGILMGLGLGIGAGFEFREILNLAFGFAAVVFILPKMGGILGGALLPVSDGMKTFIAEKFSKLGKTYIGLDVAIMFGSPAVLVTALLLMPTSIILAIILPGINFIPIGDLTNLLVPAAAITAASRGNVIRGFLIGIPVVIGTLYYASFYAEPLTQMAKSMEYTIEGYNGPFTSFLDGGQLFRGWLVQALDGDLFSLLLIPAVLSVIVGGWLVVRKREKKNAEA